MKNRKKPLQIIYAVLLFALLIPMCQHIFSFANEKKLSGGIVLAKNTTFSIDGWFSGEYQKKKDDYLKDNFGFRPDFVRINNQLDYSLFKKLHASSAIYGKEGYLYEEAYIEAYFGTDFIGDSLIESRVAKIDFIHKKLNERNKKLVVLLAPGKGSFYPEFIPDKFKKDTITSTNYKSFVKFLKQYSIPTLDFQDWFIKNKNTSKFPLYPMAGIHWSRYGEILVADSLYSYFDKILEASLPDLVIDTVISSNENKFRDYDLGDGFNTLIKVKTMPMGYPKYHIQKNSNTAKPKILFVSDSFYWGMHKAGMFGKSNFWYYNKEVYFGGQPGSQPAKEVDLLKEIDNHDVIVLLSTDANLYKFPFGFDNRLFELLKGINNK